MKSMAYSCNKNRKRESGFTLVEIMIAIAIGLLMVAGILEISLASKESSRLQRNMGFVQENIRSAIELIGKDIRRAGFKMPTAINIGDREPFVEATTSDGGGADSDQITITHQSNTDCLDQDTPANFAVNRYYIENERLMCDGNGGPPKALVEGVESMQILYGENTDGDPRSANRYVSPAEADLNAVVSVRIAMRFHSRENVRQDEDTNSYALLDSTSFTPPAGDRRLRREITTTISLRN